MRGADIVMVGSLDWDFVWQAPQEIAKRLGRAGNRVLYLENTGIRAPNFADVRRVGHRLGSWANKLRRGGVREVGENVWVHSPLVLPPFGSPIQTKLNRALFLPNIKRTADALGLRPSMLWTFLPTDTSLALVDIFGETLEKVVYYCGGDFAEVSSQKRLITRSEEVLLARADTVFANCRTLAQRLSRRHPYVHVAAPGVDLDAFPLSPPTGDTPLAGVRRPIVGYVGTFHRHMDVPLLLSLAREHREWSFVFVGPVLADASPLAALPNVRFLGSQSHDALASYIREFAVGIVPYVRSAYTETVVPTKLNEYLAMGTPVVSTDLPALRDAPAVASVISIASAAEFGAAVARALEERRSNDLARRRREVAALVDWSIQVDRMLSAIETGPSRS